MYIYLTSPLAKAKGNVWQGQPKKEPIHVGTCIYMYMCVNKYNQHTTHEYNQRQKIDAT